jgi:DNA-binding IclR family transcriptional regulator
MRDLTEVVLLAATIAAHIEGKPARIGKLCLYLELPRETTRRCLGKLIKLGLIRRDGHCYAPTARTLATDARVLAHIDIITGVMKRTGSAL